MRPSGTTYQASGQPELFSETYLRWRKWLGAGGGGDRERVRKRSVCVRETEE